MNYYKVSHLQYYFRLSWKWWVLFFLLTPTLSYSQESILAVLSNNGKIYNDFYSVLKNKTDDDISISKVTTPDVSDEILAAHDIIVTVGYSAAKKISERKPNATVIYSLIPENNHLYSNLACENNRCYYIYINQPVSRYIKLFNILFPQPRTLVLATVKTDTKVSQQLKNATRKLDISYKELYIPANNNIARVFTEKLSHGDVLLALPDAAIYNSNNAKSILLSTYHKDIPIIAYSSAFVKAGAVAGLYSSIDHVANTTAKTVNKIISNGQQKNKEYYPDEFTVDINLAVANSLDIRVESENVIKSKIE